MNAPWLQQEFTRADAIDWGLDSRALRRLLDDNEIERISRGIYRPTAHDQADADLLEIALKAPRATVCLNSALAIHELIDEIPARIHIALPRGTRKPTLIAPTRIHMFDAGTFEIERASMPIEGASAAIAIYSAERSIIDAFRTRGITAYETATEALKAWLSRPGSRPSTLLALAGQFPRASGPLMTALEILG